MHVILNSSVLDYMIQSVLAKGPSELLLKAPTDTEPKLLRVRGHHVPVAIAQEPGCSHITQSGLTGEGCLPDTWFFAAVPLQHAPQLL